MRLQNKTKSILNLPNGTTLAPGAVGFVSDAKWTELLFDDEVRSWVEAGYLVELGSDNVPPPPTPALKATDAVRIGNRYVQLDELGKDLPVKIGSTDVSLGDALGASSPSRTMAALGDSITAAAGGNLSGISVSHNLNGYVTWTLLLSRHRLLMPEGWNFGVAGETSGQIAARASQVAAVKPGYCLVLAGTNDLAEPGGAAYTISNLAAIYDALQSAGIYVIALKITPRGSLTSAQYGHLAQANAWIESQRLTRKNFSVVDAGLAYVDLATGAIKPGMSSDQLHPLIYGAYAIGAEVAKIINQLVPDPLPTFWNKNDVYHATDNQTGNLATNGLLTGTAGTVSNGVTGTLPNGFAANGSTLGGL